MAWRTLLNHTQYGPKAVRKHNDRCGDLNFVLRGRHSQGYKLDKRWCPGFHVFQKGVLLTYGYGSRSNKGVDKSTPLIVKCLLAYAKSFNKRMYLLSFSFWQANVSKLNLDASRAKQMNLIYGFR
jgi:hypothetical protein